MLLSFPFSWSEVIDGILRAGIWLPAIILLWLPIYLMNTCAWYIILKQKGMPQPSFGRMFKLTITGFALNYVTPVGLLGGEPYRIMELKEQVGTVRASSSTVLHTMMHIFSHFCFWSFSIVLFLVLYHNEITPPLLLLLAFCSIFCIAGIYLFTIGYSSGLAMRALCLGARIPFVGEKISGFITRNEQKIKEVDTQICALHNERPRIFAASLSLEFIARMVGCVEIYAILYIFNPDASYWDAVLIQAFTSLFANMVFFIPMQMGAREGGMAWSTSALHLGTIYGVFLSLIIRLREIFWIILGILLMRIGNKERKIAKHLDVSTKTSTFASP